MIDHWFLSRPKRKLNSIPEVLATFADISLNQEWAGQRGSHLSLEDALEKAGLKRIGERRDQSGSGARTYGAWVKSLGLIFRQESTGKTMLTLAGEAIMAGDSPVEVLRNQILKFQYPSAYSLGQGVKISGRFKIRPFRFLLKLLMDDRILYLTQEEIAKIISVEAENETDECYEHVVNRVHEFREKNDKCLSDDFEKKHGTFSNMNDNANVFVNWLEYTQFIVREGQRIRVLDEKRLEVASILENVPPFIDRPGDEEFFQRKYGVDPKHNKDTRNLITTKTITAKVIAEQKIKQAFIGESLKRPIAKITSDLVNKIVEQTGLNDKLVEETLLKLYPRGAVGSFMTEYFEMAFKGRDEATEFEKATAGLFQDVFGFEAKHVGPIGLTPDVLLLSDTEGYQAIIDNKAYSKYTISNDHHNRMVHNYIENLNRYGSSTVPLAFFSYIAGGFGKNFDSQVKAVAEATGVNGSGMSVSNMIKLVECYSEKGYTHKNLRDIFSVNRQILLSDFSK